MANQTLVFSAGKSASPNGEFCLPGQQPEFHGYHLAEFLRPPGQDLVVAQAATLAVPRLFACGGKFDEESDAHPFAGYSPSLPTSSVCLKLVDRTD